MTTLPAGVFLTPAQLALFGRLPVPIEEIDGRLMRAAEKLIKLGLASEEVSDLVATEKGKAILAGATPTPTAEAKPRALSGRGGAARQPKEKPVPRERRPRATRAPGAARRGAILAAGLGVLSREQYEQMRAEIEACYAEDLRALDRMWEIAERVRQMMAQRAS